MGQAVLEQIGLPQPAVRPALERADSVSEGGWLGGRELLGWADCAVEGAVAAPFCGAAAVVGAAVCCPASGLAIASVSSIPAKKRISVEIVCQRVGACRARQSG